MSKKLSFASFVCIFILVVYCLILNLEINSAKTRIHELENYGHENEKNIEGLVQKLSDGSNTISNLKDEVSEKEEKNESLNRKLSKYIDEKDPLEIEYTSEIETWSGVTQEGVEINVKYAELYKDEMDKYYDLLLGQLDDEKKKWLISSQSKWEEFIKENEELEWQVNDQQYHGGSIMSILSSDIYYRRYHDRAIALKVMYNTITFDHSISTD